MFILDKFIPDSVTFFPVSLFASEIEANKRKLNEQINGKKVCVISVGSIGPFFIKVQVVEATREFITNFEHEEKGKILYQKM